MSAEELRARIVKLESEIELQKKLLKKLEKDKSLAQGQLNAVLDPVARLPLEISSEILLQSLAPEFAYGAQRVPTVLLKICRAWADIALATPALWTTVRIRFPCSYDLEEALPVWFERARNRPLSVSISLVGSLEYCNHCIPDALWEHGGQQLKHLKISDDNKADNDETIRLFWDPRIGIKTLVSLPLLETLRIQGQTHQEQGREYWLSEIFELLRHAPNIVECTFDSMTTLDDHPASERLILPTLRRLAFHRGSDDHILRYLSLPALEELSLPMEGNFRENFLPPISTAPLQDLALYHYSSYSDVELHECLHHIPSLVGCVLWEDDSQVIADLFQAMADLPSLLPNLRHLNIQIHEFDAELDFADSWRMLVRALSTRRLLELRIVNVKEPPPADVLASLRELVLGGIEIYIGDGIRNFVVD
ncbi:F-box domain-containing protein [Mycena sanguinolenta]|uniref:F-box domain-containing protein n=1 Tax=Mycena sanguinolenta TaxID=230812 RepID=A0A8H7D7A6_9AGAR|nr:F-box domain-containing protein [Mycena sanguinolenta]